jgi:hypothetical protein
MSLQLGLQVSRSSQVTDFIKKPAQREVISHEPVKGELDVLSQLRSNIALLEDLHGRLGYMMGEVEKLIRKKL